MGYHYRARYEFILFFEKGKRRLNDLGIADIIAVPRIRGGYPAEKPRGGLGGPDRPELRAGRGRRRSVHGIGQRRRRGGASSGRRFLGNDLNPEAVRLTARSAARVRRRARAADNRPRRADQPDLLELIGSAHMTGAEYANLVASYVVEALRLARR